MSVLLSYAVVGVIPIFVALHLSYVRRRAAQEKTQTPRRGRYPMWVFVAFDVVGGVICCAAAVTGAVLISSSAGSRQIMMLILWGGGTCLVLLAYALGVWGITVTYVEMLPDALAARGFFGGTRVIAFEQIGGYIYDPMYRDVVSIEEDRRNLHARRWHSYSVVHRDKLQVMDKEGNVAFATRVAGTPLPHYAGQCIMFQGVQGRWPQPGADDDERLLSDYTKDRVAGYLHAHRWRTDL